MSKSVNKILEPVASCKDDSEIHSRQQIRSKSSPRSCSSADSETLLSPTNVGKTTERQTKSRSVLHSAIGHVSWEYARKTPKLWQLSPVPCRSHIGFESTPLNQGKNKSIKLPKPWGLSKTKDSSQILEELRQEGLIGERSLSNFNVKKGGVAFSIPLPFFQKCDSSLTTQKLPPIQSQLFETSISPRLSPKKQTKDLTKDLIQKKLFCASTRHEDHLQHIMSRGQEYARKREEALARMEGRVNVFQTQHSQKMKKVEKNKMRLREKTRERLRRHHSRRRGHSKKKSPKITSEFTDDFKGVEDKTSAQKNRITGSRRNESLSQTDHPKDKLLEQDDSSQDMLSVNSSRSSPDSMSLDIESDNF